MRISPLVAGGAAGLLLAALLAPAAGTALGRLASVRTELRMAARAADAPDTRGVPLVAPGLVTGDTATLIARIRARAKDGGVLVEEARPVPRAGALSVVRIQLSGPEKAVVTLADSLEREAPLVRLRHWSLVPVADGGVRLSGEAVAVRK